MSSLRLFISDSFDPWFNLAVEECIFRQMPADQRVLFYGAIMTPWLSAGTKPVEGKCNTRKMESDHIKLAPRSSGGRAVFHDKEIRISPLWPGNRNMTNGFPPILFSAAYPGSAFRYRHPAVMIWWLTAKTVSGKFPARHTGEPKIAASITARY